MPQLAEHHFFSGIGRSRKEKVSQGFRKLSRGKCGENRNRTALFDGDNSILTMELIGEKHRCKDDF